MKLQFKLALLLALLPCFLTAVNDPMNGKHTKEKKIEQSFDVNKNALLKIDNRYGNVDITSWNQNKIEIIVTITTNGNNEQEVQRRLDEIDVDFTGNKSIVTAQTRVSASRGNWSFFGNRSSNVNMKINYQVKMPASNSLDLRNDYGAISLNKISGDATITCNYGTFIIGELLGDNNVLKFDYTSSATIGFMKSGVIQADYSEYVVNKADNVTFKGNYTRSEFKEITSTLNFNGSYGRMTIGKAKNIKGNSRYLTQTIESVSNSLDLNSTYGKITVGQLEKSINTVIINAKYTSVDLSYNSNASFNLSTKLSYANLKTPDDIEFTLRSIQNTRSEYEGFYGKKNTGNTIQISSDYGNVKIQKI